MVFKAFSARNSSSTDRSEVVSRPAALQDGLRLRRPAGEAEVDEAQAQDGGRLEEVREEVALQLRHQRQGAAGRHVGAGFRRVWIHPEGPARLVLQQEAGRRGADHLEKGAIDGREEVAEGRGGPRPRRPRAGWVSSAWPARCASPVAP